MTDMTPEKQESPGRDESDDHLVRNFAIVGGAVTTLIIASMLVWHFARDTWEANNRYEVLAELDKANRLRGSDKLASYRIYEEILDEALTHDIEDQEFRRRLDEAKRERDALKPLVQEEIDRQKADDEHRAVILVPALSLVKATNISRV